PGSRPSNWISRSISGPLMAGSAALQCRSSHAATKTMSATGVPRSQQSQLEARRERQAAGDLLHLLLHGLLDLAARVVGGGNDQVLDHALVVGLEQRGVDLDAQGRALAVQRNLDHAGARAADDLLALELRLQVLDLLLHLLGLSHQAAEILELVEHQVSLSGMSSSAGYSSAGGGSSSDPSCRPASSEASSPLRFTASSLAPGNVFNMACTRGLASALLRSVSALAAFCCARVGWPSALDTEASQRRPVHLSSMSLSREARSAGAVFSGRNSITPGSQRTSCTWCIRALTSRASRLLSNRATTSVKFRGLGSASVAVAGCGAIALAGCDVARRAAAAPPPPPPRGAGAPLATGAPPPPCSCLSASAGEGRSAA